jgi:hypothetical protein
VTSFEPPSPLFEEPTAALGTASAKKSSKKSSNKSSKKKRISAPFTQPGAVAVYDPPLIEEPDSYAVSSGVVAAAYASSTSPHVRRSSRSGKKKRNGPPATMPGAVSAAPPQAGPAFPSESKKKLKSIGKNKKKRSTVPAAKPGAVAAMNQEISLQELDMEFVALGAGPISSRPSSSKTRKARHSTGSKMQESSTSFTSFSETHGDIEAPVVINAPVFATAAVNNELRASESGLWGIPGIDETKKKDDLEPSDCKVSKQMVYISLGVVVLIVIILAIGLGIGLNKDPGSLLISPPSGGDTSPAPDTNPPPTPFPTPFPSPFPTTGSTLGNSEVHQACSICGEGQVVGNLLGTIELEDQSVQCGSFADYCLEGNCSPESCEAFANPTAKVILANCECQPVGSPTFSPVSSPTQFPTTSATLVATESFEPCSICAEGILGNATGTITLEDRTALCGDLDDFCLGGGCSPDECDMFTTSAVQSLIANCACSGEATLTPTGTSPPV